MERIGGRGSSDVAMTEVDALLSEADRVVSTGRHQATTAAWFGAQLEARLDSAYRLSSVILGDAQEAEDVVHDAFERAWRARDSLRDPDRFEAWLSRIVVNACRDRLRRRRTGPRVVSLDSRPAGPGPEHASEADPLAGGAQRDALHRALDRLAPDQRIAVVMRFYLDLEIDEIARRLGTRPGTVKSRLHRALHGLRAEWDAAERLDAEVLR
jgi:RNA polymerase sigma-70 factor, ECF subfamily